MCDDVATSKEHVPPKCLFPEEKDIGEGKSFRSNLITVPSCDKHNSSKSKDDEYILFLLACNCVSNELSQTHFATKVMRAVRRKPHVFTEFSKVHSPVKLVSPDKKVTTSMAFKIDRKRFDTAIEHIARGIYFFKYNEKFSGSVEIFTEGLMDLSSPDCVDVNSNIQKLCKLFDKLLLNTPHEGENTEVFTFQILRDDSMKRSLLRLHFYQDFKIAIQLKSS